MTETKILYLLLLIVLLGLIKLMLPHEYHKKLLKFFKGDHAKVKIWLDTPNPAPGIFSPMQMIKLGREKKLMMFIDDALEGNRP